MGVGTREMGVFWEAPVRAGKKLLGVFFCARIVLLCLGSTLLVPFSAAAEVPVRVGHSDGFGAELAEFTRLYLGATHGKEFHATVVGPQSDGGTSDDLALLRATLAGNCQLAWVRADTLTNYDHTWGLLSVPFLFPSLEAERAFVNSGRMQHNLGKDGLLPLTMVERGPRLFVSREPLNSLADLKRQKVTVPRDRFLRDFIEELGAEPVVAGDAPVLETDEKSMPDDYPYELRCGHGLSYAVLVANAAWFGRLPPEEQAALRGVDDRVQLIGRDTWGALPQPMRPDPARAEWRERLKAFRERSLRLIGKPWSELFP